MGRRGQAWQDRLTRKPRLPTCPPTHQAHLPMQIKDDGQAGNESQCFSEARFPSFEFQDTSKPRLRAWPPGRGGTSERKEGKKKKIKLCGMDGKD